MRAVTDATISFDRGDPPTAQVIRDRITGRGYDEGIGYFDIQPGDLGDFASAAGALARDDQSVAEIAGLVHAFRTHMGEFLEWGAIALPERFTPGDPAAPPADRFFYPVVCLATLPDTLDYHRAHGISDNASRAIFADLGRHLRVFFATFGQTGLHVQGWFSLHMRGMLFDFGRLQFNRSRIEADQAAIDEAGMPCRQGDYVLNCHIPDSGPLTPEGVSESLRRAKPFFDEHFPDEGPYELATCDSWLIDEQLIDMVPGSNIARFVALWHPFSEPQNGDGAVLNFVFRRPNAQIDELPTRSSLERAIVAHLKAGGHMQTRVGWLALADFAASSSSAFGDSDSDSVAG
jgi:GNAT-like C-terminal domain/N-acyltransferase N-terminal domain